MNKWTEKKKQGYIRAAKQYLDSGADIIIMGHNHLPQLYDFNGKIFCNTGEWLRKYTYAKLEEGTISLWEYIPGKPPKAIEPVSV